MPFESVNSGKFIDSHDMLYQLPLIDMLISASNNVSSELINKLISGLQPGLMLKNWIEGGRGAVNAILLSDHEPAPHSFTPLI